MKIQGIVTIICAWLCINSPMAQGTEPRCGYPDCFFGEEILGAQVFSNGDSKLEILEVGQLPIATLIVFRFFPSKKADPRFEEAYYVNASDKTGLYYLENFPVAKNANTFPKFRFNAPYRKADFVEVVSLGTSVPLKMSLDKIASKKIDKKKLTDLYQKQGAQLQFNDYLADADKALKTVVQAINAACTTSVSSSVDRGTLTDKNLASLDFTDMQHRCAELAEVISENCKEDSIIGQKMRGLRSIRCSFNSQKKSRVELNRSAHELIFQVSVVAPRDGKGSFNAQDEVPKILKSHHFFRSSAEVRGSHIPAKD